MAGLDDVDEQAREDEAHGAVVMAGLAFVHGVWRWRDLLAAWGFVDPLLRRCWAQAWLYPIADAVRACGEDPDAVVEAFTADRPAHRLWKRFAREQMRHLLRAYPKDLIEWAPTARHILVGPDLEMLYLLPVPAEGDIVEDVRENLPLLMRFDPAFGWRVLSFVGESVPVPGWPPALEGWQLDPAPFQA
jgi:hypothetical protein